MFSKRTFWIAAMVIVAYATFQLMADVGATKLIQVGQFVMPGGTFVFAITFTLRDLIHKQMGKTVAQAIVVASALLNLITAAYLAWVGGLQAPVFYGFDQWGSIFAIAPAISVGSILAEIISELIDTEVYEFTSKRNKPQWMRVIVSNTISAPLDSVVFTLFAFTILPPLFGGDPRPFLVALPLALGQMLLKWIIGIISTPLIYLVPERREEPDLVQ